MTIGIDGEYTTSGLADRHADWLKRWRSPFLYLAWTCALQAALIGLAEFQLSQNYDVQGDLELSTRGMTILSFPLLVAVLVAIPSSRDRGFPEQIRNLLIVASIACFGFTAERVIAPRVLRASNAPVQSTAPAPSIAEGHVVRDTANYLAREVIDADRRFVRLMTH